MAGVPLRHVTISYRTATEPASAAAALAGGPACGDERPRPAAASHARQRVLGRGKAGDRWQAGCRKRAPGTAAARRRQDRDDQRRAGSGLRRARRSGFDEAVSAAGATRRRPAGRPRHLLDPRRARRRRRQAARPLRAAPGRSPEMPRGGRVMRESPGGLPPPRRSRNIAPTPVRRGRVRRLRGRLSWGH
jgi:hypothetical protein